MRLSDLDGYLVRDAGPHERGGRLLEPHPVFDDQVVGVFFDCPVCKAAGWKQCGPFHIMRRGRRESGPSWEMAGTGLDDLTTEPSIMRCGYYTYEGREPLRKRGDRPHAHFYIRSGMIEHCGDDGAPYLIKILPDGTELDQVLGADDRFRDPPRQESTPMSMTRKTYPGTAGAIVCEDEVGDTTLHAGTVAGTGFTIAWQNGPRGQNDDGSTGPATGAQVEDVLAACYHRLKQFEGLPHDNDFNGMARDNIGAAVKALKLRRQDRAARGVEGTHEV